VQSTSREDQGRLHRCSFGHYFRVRRFTRLTNGFSKKWENLNYMLAIFFVFYNFCRRHKTLNGATPAMAANLSKSFWTLKDILQA